MKKQMSPVPTARAVALSQSASRYAAGSASAWQNIVGNSARLADANRPGRAPLAHGQATPPDDIHGRLTAPILALGQQPEPQGTIQQVGWRQVEQAVSVSTKRKYNFLGIEFGPKISVFGTEIVNLPVYQETDRNKCYYAAVKQDDVAQIKHEGFKAEFGDTDKVIALKTVKQFNSHGNIFFFNSETNARDYARNIIDGKSAIVEFVMPEYHDFIPFSDTEYKFAKSISQIELCTTQTIPAMHIKHIKKINI
ncbi:hypothetical protein E4631_22310 [Hymenobacter sp. UV11]|uniref:hypothetical protein n=1 Tax=Hymenobacter sp. UV11 TaxID=1849735 RepID=UPI0010622185|nr:hypothetical protein [Hymenobacter sp. UV11]TDN38656.1 hypothetical protein A8B98_22740 [Hymenobacter sp. UV11]TFZ63569.1 hypothetical protein E4631_22310 [Hymenobacter sp. UV11]